MSGNKNGNRPGCTTFVARHVPRKLWIRFQAWCKLRDVFYKDKIIELLREAIRDTSSPEPAKRALVTLKRHEPTNVRICIRQVPTSLVRHFQAWCKLRDVSVAEKTVSMLQVAVQDYFPE